MPRLEGSVSITLRPSALDGLRIIADQRGDSMAGVVACWVNAATGHADDRAVLVAVPRTGWATREEIAARTKLAPDAVSAAVARLVARGDVRQSGKATCWQRTP